MSKLVWHDEDGKHSRDVTNLQLVITLDGNPIYKLDLVTAVLAADFAGYSDEHPLHRQEIVRYGDMTVAWVRS